MRRKGARCSRESSARKATPAVSPLGLQLSSITHRVLNSLGESLDSETRDFFEPRLGHDFSQVRVHTDSGAAASARAVNASAYTVGRHMAFDLGKYEPRSRPGRELIAHELAHTVQQSQAATVPGQLSLGEPSDDSEREAARVASAVVNKGPVSIHSHQSPTVQRQINPAGHHFDLAESASPLMAGALGSVTIDGFATGKADISGANQAELARTAVTIPTLLKQYPASTIRVIGHTDAIGQESDNQALGQARADSVQTALLGMGIPAVAVHTESRGAAELLVQTKKGEPRNRRVEVRFEPSQLLRGALSSGLSLTPTPATDLSKLGTAGSADFCAQFPNLCPGKPGGPPGAPPSALQPSPSLIPFHLMDVPALNEPFTSHGNRPEMGGDLRETWARLYSKYRWSWGLTEELAAKAANSELASTAGASQSRDYPNAEDRFNTDMKNAYPNATTIGPFNLPFKWRF